METYHYHEILKHRVFACVFYYTQFTLSLCHPIRTTLLVQLLSLFPMPSP